MQQKCNPEVLSPEKLDTSYKNSLQGRLEMNNFERAFTE